MAMPAMQEARANRAASGRRVLRRELSEGSRPTKASGTKMALPLRRIAVLERKVLADTQFGMMG